MKSLSRTAIEITNSHSLRSCVLTIEGERRVPVVRECVVSDATAATATNPAGLMSFTALESEITDVSTGQVLGTYDWAGHVTRFEESFGGSVLTTQYEYDPETHLLIKETLPPVTLVRDERPGTQSQLGRDQAGHRGLIDAHSRWIR